MVLTGQETIESFSDGLAFKTVKRLRMTRGVLIGQSALEAVSEKIGHFDEESALVATKSCFMLRGKGIKAVVV